MTEPAKIIDMVEARRKSALQGLSPNDPLKSGGGGGTFDGMEARVAKLEAVVEHVSRDVTDLRGDMKDVRDRLKGLEVTVGHLPSKAFVFGVYGMVGAFIAAAVVFQTQIQTFFGVNPPAP